MPAFATGYRNALQVRPFNSSYVVNNAAPLPVAVSGGGGGAEQPALQASPFRRSLDRQRATEAAGTSAYLTSLDAPLPPNLNLPRNGGGTYEGAYGTGKDAERTANAARQGLIARTRTTANFGFEDAGEGPNFLDRQQFAHDANARANAGSAATVGLAHAQTGKVAAEGNDLSERTRLIVPKLADQMDATTDAARSRTYQNDQLTTPLVEGQRAKNRLTDATAASVGDDARATKQQYDALARQHADAQKRIQFLERQLAAKSPAGGAVAPGTPGAAPATPTPQEKLDLEGKENKLVDEEATRQFNNQNFWGRTAPSWLGGGFTKEQAVGKVKNERAAGRMAAPNAAAANPGAPKEGTLGVDKTTGRSVIFRGGQYVYADQQQ